jgi:hypothetical protein
MQNENIHHYNVIQSPLPHIGCRTAGLPPTSSKSGVLEAGPVSYKFHALDYFDNETQALGHAMTWARDWVDSRG